MGNWCMPYHEAAFLWSILGFLIGYVIGRIHTNKRKGRRP